VVPTTLGGLLVDAAERHPDRKALVSPTGSLTYNGLGVQAHRLATQLAEGGVRPGDRVAICLPKSPELSVGVFGTLLAGGCYVPIDPTTPIARSKLIIDDAQPRAVLCTTRMAKRLFDGVAGATDQEMEQPSHADGRRVTLCLLDDNTSPGGPRAVAIPWPQVMSNAARSGSIRPDPDVPAYILYTSGSTGRPKGVVHTHRSAMAFVRWAAAQLRLGTRDVVSQHASPSFDLTVFDFFSSALAAATLVSIPEWLFGQLPKTYRFIVERGITVWYSVPSALLRDGSDESLALLTRSSLRRVVFAGEVIPKHSMRRFAKCLPPGCEVSNWYGPTETNVCTFHDIRPIELESEEPIPIGSPCPFATVRIERTGGGEIAEGELLVSSATLMEGYWKLDDLTAKAFVQQEGRRFYRTGDVVSTNPDGGLLLVGRKDRLLKIRGYRVQPEEVERVLATHPDVIEAAVIVLPEDGLARLGAAVATRGAADEVTTDGLRRQCAEMLPPYMVPSVIVPLPALPRGTRGKVDLAAVSELISPRSRLSTPQPHEP
jgi:amino acid adenylation domain-containing protein